MPLSDQRRAMLLRRDAIAPSSEAYRVARNATVLTNADGTFPRVRRLSDTERVVVDGISENSAVYRVRVVAASVTTSGAWTVQINGGSVPARFLGMTRGDAGGNAWVFDLEVAP